jgi:hypothetical protein
LSELWARRALALGEANDRVVAANELSGVSAPSDRSGAAYRHGDTDKPALGGGQR